MSNAPTSMKRNAAIAGVLALAAYGGWTAWQQMAPQPSEQASGYIAQLRDIAGKLQLADAKGDRAGAANLADPLSATLRSLNDTPDIERTSLANCRLAATHLVDGVGAVYTGHRWQERDRFDAALVDCR